MKAFDNTPNARMTLISSRLLERDIGVVVVAAAMMLTSVTMYVGGP